MRAASPTGAPDSLSGTLGSLYSATHRLSTDFAGLAWAAFQLGDTLQRSVLDAAFDLARFRLSGTARLVNAVAGQAMELYSFLPVYQPPRNPVAELEANFEVFQLVQQAASAVPRPPGGGFPLVDMIGAAYRKFDYRVLWVIEGMGHDYAEFKWQTSREAPVRLLDDPAIPAKSLTMLHAGLGLFLASETLKTLTPFAGRENIAASVHSFVDHVESNSKAGYAGAGIESLGLVTRTWYPEMVPLVSSALPESLRGYFWHGAGRALYFLPVHALPGISSAWTAACREAVDAESGLNLKAGLAWATILVNLRQLETVENLIARLGGELIDDGGFRNGVNSALVMASDISPGDPAFDALIQRQPAASVSDNWTKLVRDPAIDAIRVRREKLRAEGRMQDAFRYQFAWDQVP